MVKNSISDYIFKWKELNNLFDKDDNELDSLDKKISKTNKELSDFIDKKVHPKIRKRLKALIEDDNDNLIGYCYREGQLYYNAGFKDGMKLILSILIS